MSVSAVSLIYWKFTLLNIFSNLTLVKLLFISDNRLFNKKDQLSRKILQISRETEACFINEAVSLNVAGNLSKYKNVTRCVPVPF